MFNPVHKSFTMIGHKAPSDTSTEGDQLADAGSPPPTPSANSHTVSPNSKSTPSSTTCTKPRCVLPSRGGHSKCMG